MGFSSNQPQPLFSTVLSKNYFKPDRLLWLTVICMNKAAQTTLRCLKGGVIILFSFLVTAHLAVAQQRQPDRGFQAANSYSAGSFDAVNVSNGNVVINLPIASLPAGRGTSPGFTVTLQYNSKLWDSKQTTFSSALQQGVGQVNIENESYSYYSDNLMLSDRGGWKMLTSYRLIQTNRMNLEDPDPCLRGDPIEKISARWKLEMEFPDGSVKHFIPIYQSTVSLEGYYNIDMNGVRHIAATQTNPANGLCDVYQSTSQASNGMHYMTTDGSRLRLFIPYQNPNWKMYSPDGTVVENAPPNSPGVDQRITDRNANFVEIRGTEIVDQLGRSINLSGDGITVKGVGGEDVTTQIVSGSRWVHRRYKAIEFGQGEPQGTEHYD